MLTTFEQVKDWIQDNGFKRWVLYRDKSRAEKIIDSNAFTVSDQDDKIDMTEKYLRMAGGTAYAAGSATGAQADLNVTAEVRLQEPQAQQPTAGIAGYPSIGELTETITKQVRAEMEVQRMKDKEAELSRREKELDAREQSAMGALVHFLAPVGQALLQKHVMPRVAGVDAEEPVHAAPIVPNQPQETPAEEKEQEDFTDEESQEIYALLVRFKKVEPDYLVMLRKVVDMAESGDATYKMAKGFLVQ